MSGTSQLDFYRARADQARADADAATLAHVRERCLRSQEAWVQLANRAARAEEMREKLLAEKVARETA
ncbi:MAG TPA: hypothetical protein VFK50_10350 [Sphingomicrobium sp.]|nr:hypothetical protein [Sphingomicrobium sp.]